MVNHYKKYLCIKATLKKVFLYLFIFSFFNYIGCYSSKAVDKEILISKNIEEPVGELSIITNDDQRIIIDEITYQIVDDTLYLEGIDLTNTEVYGKPINLKLAVNDIQYVEIDELDVFRTVGCITASVGAVVMSVILVFLFEDYKGCEGPKSLNDLN
jgi:hypothetical protein